MHPGDVLGILISAVVALTVIITIGMTWHHARKAKHLERMAMIEKGMNPHEMETYFNGMRGIQIPSWMKFSSTAAGLGIGTMISGVLTTWFPLAEGPMTIGPLLLMGGVGLGLPYFLTAYFQTHGQTQRG
ncbi:MAG: DUF6249 domain-containing protein [Bacteroidota bacterium]